MIADDLLAVSRDDFDLKRPREVLHQLACGIALELWNQILGASQQKDVGSVVFWQPFIGLTRDSGPGQTPAEAEGSVAGTGVIGKRQLRRKTRPSRADGQWNRHRSSARYWIGGEFLPHSADRSAAFRQGDGGH